MIRVQFSRRLLSNRFGPGIFMNRLMRELSSGYAVTIVQQKPHVIIDAIAYSPPPKGCKLIFRVDGCYYEKHRVDNNKGIKAGLKKADGVVYQSKFAKRLNDAILGVRPKLHTIICNGFDQQLVKSVLPMTKRSNRVFVSSARWRNSKRPKSILEGFRQAKIKDAVLVMIGEGKILSADNVVCTGNLSPQAVWRWYRIADALMHLCFIDSCPNSVIEALSFGVPVLCNNIGGTPEIVGGDGIILDCDRFDFKVIRKVSDDVPPEVVAQGLHQIMDRQWLIDRPDLDIKRAAKEYAEFIRKVVS